MTTKQQDFVYETIASALYNMEWCFFEGEFPAEDGRVSWRGRFLLDPSRGVVPFRIEPRQLRITIAHHDEDFVIVTLIWKNVSGAEPLSGMQELRIRTTQLDGMDPQTQFEGPTTLLVQRVLEVWRDIVGQIGVAGKIEDLAPENEAGDEDAPEDMAKTDEEVGRE